MKMLTSQHRFLPALVGAVLVFGLSAAATDRVSIEKYGGRSMIVYVPSQLSPPGTRALVIVLHGGMGNAQRIESAQSENGLKSICPLNKT